ncbi:Protein of unknown function [Propionibacterium freudenreichii subsp. freudenreichii]|nr:Hypothetical protein PFREUD_23390 [Propionibacterium freudenreichii subsp. shermanii CIRM-BIA1]CDP49480.1 Protein of unknown function [Propionibacterium freudenreichii subsp. freudenreichii]
MPGAERT